MAIDAGIKLVVDGEKNFKTAMAAVNSQIQSLGSEMKLAVAEMGELNDSEDGAAKKTEILQKKMEAAKQKVGLLSTEYEKQREKLRVLEAAMEQSIETNGQTSKATIKARNEYNKQVIAVNKLGTSLNNAKSDVAKMKDEMEDTADSTKGLKDSMKSAEKGVSSFGEQVKAYLSADAIKAGVEGLVNKIAEIADETEEYRKIMGTLSVSSEKAGYSTEQTRQTYEQLYRVLGDTQTAATATANLQALHLSQEKLTQMTQGAIGAWATYGDSIPIDGLAEAINETIQAGTVTGTFADVLNWAGTSEDDFNEKLAATQDPTERANLVLQELANQGLTEAADKWNENNQAIADANMAQEKMNSSTAELAERIAPAITTVKEIMADMLLVAVDMADGFAKMAEEGDPLSAVLIGLAVAAGTLAIAINMTAILTAVSKGFTAVQTAATGLFVALAANPIGIVIAALAGLVTGLVVAYNTNEDFRNKVNAAWESLKASVGPIAHMFVTLFTEDMPNATKSLKDKLSKLPSEVKQIGTNIVKGLAEGMENAKKWLKNKVKSFCEGIKTNIKDFFGIHSPSTVMRDEVGVMLGEGIAEGIKKSEEEVLSAADKLNNKLLKKEEELSEKLSKEGIDDKTKASLTTQLNSIKSFQQEYATSLDNIKKAYDSAMTSLEKSKNSFQEKMADYGDLFNKTTNATEEIIDYSDVQEQLKEIEQYNNALKRLTERGISDDIVRGIQNMKVSEAIEYMNGLLKMSNKDYEQYFKSLDELKEKQKELSDAKNLGGEVIELGDLKSQIEEIKEYGKAIEELKAKGTPKGLLSEIQGMNIDDATVYMSKLLKMTDEDYSEYIKLWQEKQEEAAKIADEYYADEIEKLKDNMTEQLNSYYEDFNDIGENLMNGISEGIVDGKSSVVNSIKKALEEAVEEAKTAMGIASPSKVFAEIGGYMVEGVGVGFKKKKNTAFSAIKDTLSGFAAHVQSTSLEGIGKAEGIGSRAYSYGDIILNVDHINNGSNRDVQTFARELEFLRQQQAAGKGAVTV